MNPRHYSPGVRGSTRQTDEERVSYFWSRVKRKSNNDCWNWTGGTVAGRYGGISFRGKPTLAHRLAWIASNGEIPADMQVLHKCDNGFCCNPHHLFLGTQKDNVLDMHSKGRANKAIGEQAGNSKLTTTEVKKIKRLLARGKLFEREIAAKFGVARIAINHIRAGRCWRHVQI